jgi:hypothetical protein
MKIKVSHFNKQVFKNKMNHLSHLDFSYIVNTITNIFKDNNII